MIIVSQDKMELVNFNAIENIWICPDEEGRFTIEATADTNATLGYYKTGERAKQVLEDIHRVYGLSELYKYSTEEEREAIMDGLSQVDQFPFKYEMPKE